MTAHIDGPTLVDTVIWAEDTYGDLAELASAFGPGWLTTATLVRQLAAMTPAQVSELAAAPDTRHEQEAA